MGMRDGGRPRPSSMVLISRERLGFRKKGNDLGGPSTPAHWPHTRPVLGDRGQRTEDNTL